MPIGNLQMNVPAPGPGINTSFGADAAGDILRRGAQTSFDLFNQVTNRADQQFGAATQGLQPFAGTGTQANQRSAALSGALGPEAQAAAFQEFQFSPGVDFLREEGERAITRNAARTGGLGGGNVLRELNRFGQGIALQNLGSQIGQLENIANRGIGAATSIADIDTQKANTIAGLGRQAAAIPFDASRDIANVKFQAGRDIASQIANTTSSLANLVNNQGAGTADILGIGMDQVNQLIQGAQQGDAAAQQQLATILVNMGQGAGSNVTGLPIIPGFQSNTLGQVGQLAGGIGGILQTLPQGQT